MDFTRCYGCMRELPALGMVCPHCGYDNTNDPGKQPSHVLPCGTILNGQYMLGRSLGQGGFGITYIGWDLNLEIPLCIKEYYPEGSAMRSATQSHAVYWGTSENAQEKKENRKVFVKEAAKAVKLRDLSHVVTVWGVFYENETAYIVMDYIEGETLKSRLVRTQKTLSEKECVELLAPVMEDLGGAHKRGIIHRDIKPDNIMLRSDGEPMLLDMGAAKDLSKANGSTRSSSTVVSEGFSPLEQYREKGNIGAWTDVYAMSATIYFCVTGKVPDPAIDRIIEDNVSFGAFTPAFSAALRKGLVIRSENRIQTMGELKSTLVHTVSLGTDSRERAGEKHTPEKNTFKRCYRCMEELPWVGAACPRCGYKNSDGATTQPTYALALGTVLNDRYIAGCVLAQDGFGITYIGYDTAFSRRIRIKEFFLFGSEKYQKGIKMGREIFINAARIADRLRDLSIIPTVFDIFYENETAYIVAEYIEGETLKSRLIKTQKTMSEKECIELLTPLMEDLATAHTRGFILRDITPDNIMYQEGKTPVLSNLDMAIDLNIKREDVLVVKQGFSPPEQYTANGRLGAWTDVYIMCATLYYCMKGRVLPTSIERLKNQAVDFQGLSPKMVSILRKGLALKVEDRIQNMDELIKMLSYAKNSETTPNLQKQEARPSGVSEREREEHLEKEYQRAKGLMGMKGNDTALKAAEDIFIALGEYKDSSSKAEECRKQLEQSRKQSSVIDAGNIQKGAQVGSIICFGSYQQTQFEKTPIEWIVLRTEENRMLLISRFALNTKPFHRRTDAVTWQNCDLRRWLNESFYNKAFSPDERQQVLKVTLNAKQRSFWRTIDHSSKDNVFLLSVEEAQSLFSDDDLRQCKPTLYAKERGCEVKNNGNCRWWLRSSGSDSEYAAIVLGGGDIYPYGTEVGDSSIAVRPAVWIRI